MDITYDVFVRFCPSTVHPDDQLFRAVAENIRARQLFIRSLLGDSLYGRLDDIVYYADVEPMTNDEHIIYNAVGVICTQAYCDTVPHMDLVLTQTGFGVVSNANVAPASADRVERLRRSLLTSAESYFDSLLDYLRHDENWNCSEMAVTYIPTLFWRSEHTRYFGIAPSRAELRNLFPKIADAVKEVERLISPEQYRTLLAAERTASASIVQLSAIDLLRSYIAAIVLGRHSSYRLTLLSFLDSNISEFSEYKNSSAYEANHFEPYRNRKDDTCFFFG